MGALEESLRGQKGIFSLNAQRKCRDSEALDTVLDAVRMIDPNWIVLNIAEVDGSLQEGQSQFSNGGHFYHRYYPGAGSVAMLLIVRKEAILGLCQCLAKEGLFNWFFGW